jgi:hypothetical protein
MHFCPEKFASFCDVNKLTLVSLFLLAQNTIHEFLSHSRRRSLLSGLELPEDVQAVLEEYEEVGTTSSKEYSHAFSVSLQRTIISDECLSPFWREIPKHRVKFAHSTHSPCVEDRKVP